MAKEDSLHAALASGKVNAEHIVTRILADRRLLESVFHGISSNLARVRFGCSKTLLLASMKNPDLLYGKIDEIIGLLDSKNQILKWNAIAMLGNLAEVDRGHRIQDLLHRLFGFISSGELITANNAIIALGKIGRALPDERKVIASQLLTIENCSFDTDECRNIAIGRAILALEMFIDPLNAGGMVFEFARRQTGNRRKATAAKAKALVRKLSISAGASEV